MVSSTVYSQGRIQFFQAFGEITHTHGTAQGSGRAGVNESALPKYLRKVMIHPFGYLTVLAFAKWGDASTTSASIFPNLMQTFADIHAEGSQFGTLIKRIKDTDNFRITAVIQREP